MKKVIFTGSGVAIVTPLNADESVNYDKLGELIEFHIANQTDCIVICGTTGEASTLNDEEHIRCIAYTCEKVNGRIPVVAGVGSNDTHHAIKLTKAAKDVGADGLLHVTPYYNKTSPSGLIRHFTACADATDLPVILYNVPSRTNMNMKVELYSELCKHPNIVAVKEAGGDISSVADTAAICGDDLKIYSGNDDQIVPIMSLGGIGVISVLANILPKETHDICALYLEGKVKESCALQLKLLKFIHALFVETSPIPVKTAMNLMGFDVGPMRMPLAPISDAGMAVLKREMAAIGLLK